MNKDPLLKRLDVINVGHARTSLVQVVGNIVDDWTPVDQVARGLMGKLLTMLRVALVTVISNELALVLPEQRRVSISIGTSTM